MNQKTVNIVLGGCVVGLLIGIFVQFTNSSALRGRINELETHMKAMEKKSNEKPETSPEQPKIDDSSLRLLANRVSVVELTANGAARGVASLEKRSDIDDAIRKANDEILRAINKKIDLIRREQ